MPVAQVVERLEETVAEHEPLNAQGLNELLGDPHLPEAVKVALREQLTGESGSSDLRVQFFVNDHLGTPVRLVDGATQETLWAREQDPWGNTLREWVSGSLDPDEVPMLRFQGQQFDWETGLHYNRYRYYDPGVRRYLGQDPIGLLGGWNAYSYPTNPVQWVDPLGLEPGTLAQRGYPQNAQIWTDSKSRTTLFYDPNKKETFQMETRNDIANSSKPDSASPYDGYITYCQSGLQSPEYGTTKIYTTDIRYRWIHGGGSGAEKIRKGKSLDPKQGWYPTLGCTRGQNEDVEKLCDKIKEFKKTNPKANIEYRRY